MEQGHDPVRSHFINYPYIGISTPKNSMLRIPLCGDQPVLPEATELTINIYRKVSTFMTERVALNQGTFFKNPLLKRKLETRQKEETKILATEVNQTHDLSVMNCVLPPLPFQVQLDTTMFNGSAMATQRNKGGGDGRQEQNVKMNVWRN